MKNMKVRTVASVVAYNFPQLPSLPCLKTEQCEQEHKGTMLISLLQYIFLLYVISLFA